MKKLIYIGMGLFLCLSAAVWTGCDKNKDENNATLSGVVTDRMTGKAVSKADVELQPAGLTATTDADGQYTFSGLAAGDYNLKVTKNGYVDCSVAKISVPSNQTARCDVQMKEKPLGEAVNMGYDEWVAGVIFEMGHAIGGTFQMGATSEQFEDALPNEIPVHLVTLDGFYISKYVVTQEQWFAVMGTKPWWTKCEGQDNPAQFVSCDDAIAFCEKLSAMTGKTYRLPTEAEWEYAARCGQNVYKYSGSDNLDEVGWYGERCDCPYPVGKKKPNAWGLYDMSGNIWEWCLDGYGPYSDTAAVNPQAPLNWFTDGDNNRVARGGAWEYDPQYCRVSVRGAWGATTRFTYLGFRIVCEE